MKVLGFHARSFSWQSHSQTLTDADPAHSHSVLDTAVFWLHVEQQDETNHQKVFKHTLKHIKWQTNKSNFSNIVLHSFAHLGGISSSSDYARQFLRQLEQRLTPKYNVHQTPFGWFCSWQIDVYGDSMSKVFRSF